MARNYFEYNGKKYYTGTVCISKYNKRIIFLEHDENTDEYTYLRYPVRETLCRDHFFRMISYITDEVKQNPHEVIRAGRFKELDIDGMPQAWIVYIFFMAISFVFKDALVLWALISVIFFTWRKNKIDDEGWYYGW